MGGRPLRCAPEPVPEQALDQVMAAFSAVDHWESSVHAFREIFVTDARAAAVAVDAQPGQTALSGSPFAVKEVFEVASGATSGGSPVYKDRKPTRDATVVRRLRDAGAVLVGTQISHELTCGADEPPTRNPWNRLCYPGGSSAGAGVSVATGMARFALGTDAAGSVRIPAAMTGTTGFKPSAGRISTAGVFRKASAPSIDNVGIIARSAEEVSEVLNIIAGPDPVDPRTMWADLAPLTDIPQNPRALTIATLGSKTVDHLNQVYALDPEISTAFDVVCDQYRANGAKIKEVELPELGDAIGAIVTLFTTELAVAHRDDLIAYRSGYFPAIAEMLESSLTPDPDALHSAISVRTALRRAVDALFEAQGIDFLITPTTPRVAMELEQFDPAEELGSLIPYTCGFNLTGHPALSLPSGFTHAGLPIGHQIVGPAGRDGQVLWLGQSFQSQTDWHLAKPTIAG